MQGNGERYKRAKKIALNDSNNGRGSDFHDVFTAKDISESLLKKIITESNLSYIPAIKWGIDDENTAKEEYVSKMLATRKNFVYSQAGFVINPLYLYFGATPDGFVYCDCWILRC